MKEIWKDIKGYEGYYEVSNLGRVRRIGKTNCLKSAITKDGYKQVALSVNNILKSYAVHRLVALAFIPNPNNYPQVNHKDENKENNTVFFNEDGSIDQYKTNLEWCTQEYNLKYGTARKRANIKNTNRKDISKVVYQYSLEGKLINIYPSTQELRRLGFNQGNIASCCRGERKSHKGYIWKYED